jgi:hypothetical protein
MGRTTPSFRIALAIREESECRIARITGRVEVLYYSSYRTQYNFEYLKVERVRFAFMFSFLISMHSYIGGKKRRSLEKAAAEVVGSNPTRSISSNLVDYGIELRLF